MFVVAEMIQIWSRHNSWDQSLKLVACVRAVMLNSLYRILIDFKQYDIKSKNLGKIINLISNDLTRIEFRFFFLACLAGLFLGLFATGVVLVLRLGWWGLIALAIPVLYQLVAIFLGNKIG